MVLAIVGLYSVVALIVGQRRREIGVRLALGAQPGTVVRMILGEGAVMAAVGVVLGVGGALALTRVMTSMLYGIAATDAWTFTGAAALVTLVALGASYVPARRAARAGSEDGVGGRVERPLLVIAVARAFSSSLATRVGMAQLPALAPPDSP